ncbi:MAG: chemotaxis protein CheB [Candidatus Tectimicrobiota bacterium]
MPGHDIIVIGGSAGSLEPLQALVRGLPPDLPASLCVTRHISPDAPNVLPAILGRAGALPVSEALDGEPLQVGRIYVGPPDYHLLVTPGYLQVRRSAPENRFRPAIDPLFRSAAVAYGCRVVGILLSGGLDDGTAGLWAIKQRGGIAVIQDPREAQVPSMPSSAQTYVPLDYCLATADLAPLVVRLAHEAVPDAASPPASAALALENQFTDQGQGLMNGLLQLGQLSPYTCPTCHGMLLELKAGRFMRFRCHTGHAFSALGLLAALSESLDESLWSTLRACDESVLLLQHMAEHLRGERHDEALAALFTQQAAETRQRSDVLRDLLRKPALVPLASTQQKLCPGANDAETGR